MKKSGFLIAAIMLWSSVCVFAYEREVVGDISHGYVTDLNEIETLSNNMRRYAKIGVYQFNEKSNGNMLEIDLTEMNSDYNKVAAMCKKAGEEMVAHKTLKIYLSNGEALTTNAALVVDSRKDEFKDDFFGILRIAVSFSEIRSDRFNPSSVYARKKYIGQQLRNHSIKRISVLGYDVSFPNWNTQSDIDEICAALEKEEGEKLFTYSVGSTPRNTGSYSSSSSSSSYSGSTSSYSSPKSTMYGSVRYITPAKSSSLSYLRECINKWEQCRTGGFTSARGIAVYSTNGYAYTSGMPTSFIDKIKEINKNEYKIEDVNVTAQGYVVVFGTYGYSVVSGPQAFIDKLHRYNAEKEHITSAVFNDSGRWAVVTDKNISWSDDYVGEFMKAAKAKFGFINSMFISANGAMIACCANGVYYKNVPSNVIDKIKSLSYIPKVVKFTDDGLYLITDGKSAYTYFL